MIYHLFQNREASRDWLRHKLQCRVPDDATVVLNKFTDLPLVSIWDFILETLNLPAMKKWWYSRATLAAEPGVVPYSARV